MAKKGVYEPGELDRVRNKLGVTDKNEAQRIANLLGGEVGTEKEKEPEKPKPRVRHETVNVAVNGRVRSSKSSTRTRPKHAIELPPSESGESLLKKLPEKKLNPLDDPSMPVRCRYFDRIKLDKYAGLTQFDIKSTGQVIHSLIAVVGVVPDYVNPVFITNRMEDYYKRIELLVLSTRQILPRNNVLRSQRLKMTSPFYYSILDVLRFWDIEKIGQNLARLQAHPRNIKTTDFSEILKAIYKPLFILEKLDPELHIKGAFKVLYKVLVLENPTESKEKFQEPIREAMNSYLIVLKDIRYLLYPLLMKVISSTFVPYNLFFSERKNRFLAFIGAKEEEQILPTDLAAEIEYNEAQASAQEGQEEGDNAEDLSGEKIDENDPQEKEKRAKLNAEKAERKAFERGLSTLEALFPKAGWDKLSEFPDFYPYFADIFDLKRGYELIAPNDPLLVMAILMRMLEELFFGLRYVTFGVITGSDGHSERVNETMESIINNWHRLLEVSFNKEYLPRLKEYCRILETESRTSTYAKRILNDLYWLKRLYFFPYFRFESLFSPSIQKKDVDSLYPEIRRLRKYLTSVATGIEHGIQQGGAEKKAPCDGIDNPWEQYKFEVSNPLSMRLNALLGEKKRNNATLVFFTLAITTVLDYLVNNENSWAYDENAVGLFRSIDGKGVMPQTGVDVRIDADALFRDTLKQKMKK
ncbi:hypothetical protein FACS1894200_09010 [Spirochaetia bacterium]|nr:hypothetical protein FACS1894200_09010 [Spirochaetia bacterium]